jgi:FixJ family two-component response regulator
MICNIVSIVDDDPMVRDATVDLLNSYGYTALGFGTAEEFLNSGEVENTCCLITDQNLPGLSGTDLQKHLCAAGYRTPIIFITAYPVAAIRERALAAGAIAYLPKPFDEAVLMDCLQTALSSSRSRQSAQRRV